MKTYYYLDPDFRKEPTTKIYCARCQKPINLAKQKAIRITVNWEIKPIWQCYENIEGMDLIGPDCAKKIGMR